MNSKKLITMSLVGLSCLAVTASFIALSNHNVIRPVQSESQSRTVIMNNNTFYQKYFYYPNGQRNGSYAFFELDRPGSYAPVMDFSYTSQAYFGNGHLYVCPTTEAGVRIGFHIDINSLGEDYHPETGKEIYFDQALTRRIYMPTFSNITQIEVTLGEENTIPFDVEKERIESDNDADVEKINDKKYILTNIASNLTFLPLVSIIATQEQVNQHLKLVIDQVIITYTC